MHSRAPDRAGQHAHGRDPIALSRAADLLSAARRLVLYGGGGLITSGSGACEAFARYPMTPAGCGHQQVLLADGVWFEEARQA